MSKIKGINTTPELLFRKMLWKSGYRYRIHYKNLPGNPDIVFIQKRVIVFIDGEFWHGFEWRKKKPQIKANRKYWIEKIERNISRDKKTTHLLRKQGWTVLRYWMHEINNQSEKCLSSVIKALS
jgi:DNA mismatch endonuclease (patch repair protein)